uniref:Uncharacterized protein n=1 Tax=Cacopsylla melanoneura TaxID=428564 RepID=A0A8D9ERH1_9HEMI
MLGPQAVIGIYTTHNKHVWDISIVVELLAIEIFVQAPSPPGPDITDHGTPLIPADLQIIKRCNYTYSVLNEHKEWQMDLNQTIRQGRERERDYAEEKECCQKG